MKRKARATKQGLREAALVGRVKIYHTFEQGKDSCTCQFPLLTSSCQASSPYIADDLIHVGCYSESVKL